MTQKTKILLMITKGNFGGAQHYLFDLATNLPQEDFEVVVACGEGETLRRKLSEKNIRTIKIESLSRNINFIKDIRAFFEISKIIKSEKPTLIHLNSSKMGFLGGIAGRMRGGTRIVFTGHGWAFNEERSSLSKICIGILHWITILLSHRTIAVSEKTKEQIKKFPFVKNKIITIENGIGPVDFLSRSDARLKLLPNKENNLWIGTISELHKNKGLDFCLEAFANIAQDFPNALFVIIGEGEERKNLEHLIEKNNLVDRIFLLGFKADANVFLKAFDIATLTSRTEAFPYFPLEAGSAGIPIVASWVGGIPEIVINGETGLLTKKGDLQDIEGALRELILNGAEREELGNEAKERINEHFSLKKMLERTVSLYKSLQTL
jgi:glycosyltransferase involved in cell wall biosynthesis